MLVLGRGDDGGQVDAGVSLGVAVGVVGSLYGLAYMVNFCIGLPNFFLSWLWLGFVQLIAV